LFTTKQKIYIYFSPSLAKVCGFEVDVHVQNQQEQEPHTFATYPPFPPHAHSIFFSSTRINRQPHILEYQMQRMT
jgi:hypothetical protein